jgi:hypothetical protein
MGARAATLAQIVPRAETSENHSSSGEMIMPIDQDDPRAPYQVYEGDELRGTYLTRAEARRKQQQQESEQANRNDPPRHCSIKDRNGHPVS